jgi:signal transduction histidine kinase
LLEQKKTWEAQQKNTLLSQVEELKTNFISMMSHDLKTPIARIQGMTDIILKDSVILSPKQREAIDFIRSSPDDLLRVLNSILNYAKIESDGVVLNKTSRDINKMLEEVILRHQFLAKMKGIQIVFEPETLFPILVDGDIMKQVFSNLIENAIKYSPENTKILIVTEELGDRIRIQVSDQGLGISQEDLPFIFSKFFRGSMAKISPIKGSGLGLYLTKYFIELHGGKISVESEVNLGTTFTVDLQTKSES